MPPRSRGNAPCAFSTSLTTTVFSQRSMWWFAATLRKGGCEGPHLHLLHSTTSKSSTYIEPLSVLVAHVASQSPCHIATLLPAMMRIVSCDVIALVSNA